MSEPITVTATVAAWLPPFNQPHQLVQAMKAGDQLEAVRLLSFYGAPDKEEFCNYTRVGEADITVRLIPQDEQVRMAVQVLQRQLDEDRAKWLERQRQILEQIQNLQAISYDEPAAEVEA